jgi:hypothetical protein
MGAPLRPFLKGLRAPKPLAGTFVESQATSGGGSGSRNPNLLNDRSDTFDSVECVKSVVDSVELDPVRHE